MSETDKKAVLLWISGIGLVHARAIPEMETLMQRGATVEFESMPITGSQSHYYQVTTGRRPACFGFFDTLALRGYSVVEQLEGRDTPPDSLLALMKAAGWTASYNEVGLSELVSSVQSWIESASSYSCLIVRCILRELLTPETSAIIEQAIRLAQNAVGETGLLALLSDAQATQVKQFVNLNNFLADMGVMERNKRDGSIDWSNTLAHHMGHGQLWINLIGRNAKGIVHHQGEYEEVCDTLISALPAKLRDPQTGEPVIERIYRKEELYNGDYLFCAPDLVVNFHPGYASSQQSTRLTFDKSTFIRPAKETTSLDGVHPTSGFLVASGPAFAQGKRLHAPAPLTSVAPTLLHALSVKHGPMDSSALQECFDADFLAGHPIHTVQQQQDLSNEEEELVINRLRDLGYI